MMLCGRPDIRNESHTPWRSAPPAGAGTQAGCRPCPAAQLRQGCLLLAPQILPAAVVAPLFFRGEIEFGVINQSASGECSGRAPAPCFDWLWLVVHPAQARCLQQA